ncbi:MAG: sodium:solute symporter [Crocinitomicaceae bacterium]|nr:sodium:solute symporter [Crocinitomicaceae bacterium]|tara:strand:+ start:2490 stop:4163 length:1674 start_codon:yes stop_codon:yes gene_type:complete
MSGIDWAVLLGTLGLIVGYGTYMTRKSESLEGYLKGGSDMKWLTIGLSVMATQASAITFISTPGVAYESGMEFVQNYFGLPFAIIIVCVVFIPIYYRLKVYTAYEYLEQRFDIRIRLITASLFMLSRGLAAGITIYAPAIIISVMLGWSLQFTILLVGILVIIYTVSGGTKAVSLTQKWQMTVILIGMGIAFSIVLNRLPDEVSFLGALDLAGAAGRMNIVDFSLDLDKRYTFWSGITGGLFLALSYFGTDQSQVQRYLSGKSIQESRLGLIFNALLKIPMQFLILLTGVLVFVFYQFESHPVLFNKGAVEEVHNSEYQQEFSEIEQQHEAFHLQKKAAYLDYVANPSKETQSEILALDQKAKSIRDNAKKAVLKANPDQSSRDSDYVFLTFILNYLPQGLVGLLIAVIISAAMSSTAGEINALASTTMVDFYQRFSKKSKTELQSVNTSKWLTLVWGVIAIIFALSAQLVENLIEAVNILGSVFYGTILGVFLTAFFLKKVGAKAVLVGIVIGQLTVFLLFYNETVGYLWFNVIGCAIVMIVSYVISIMSNNPNQG